ncbi:MAG: hypothetical protein U5O69_09045, partial [Candidatus Competibacteraceae bacterium]|nr:hypothetical protein [Candidatus Competibacteraceae bacterium]
LQVALPFGELRIARRYEYDANDGVQRLAYMYYVNLGLKSLYSTSRELPDLIGASLVMVLAVMVIKIIF